MRNAPKQEKGSAATGRGDEQWRAAGLERLYDERRRVALFLVVLMSFVAVVATADLVLGVNRARVTDLGFGLMYGACASVLATLLVALTQVQFRVRERQDTANEMLRLLGIEAARDTRTAIVVTAWPAGPDVPAVAAPLLGPVGSQPDARDYTTYVRRDILLVADLVRLVQKAGLAAPQIVSDRDFLANLDMSRRNSRHALFTTADDDTIALTNVVVVGLWANRVTQLLVDRSPRVLPFRLEDAEGQTIKSFPPDSSDDTQYTPYGPQNGDPAEPGHAFMGRFHLKDTVLCVLGGTYGLPTARLGDLVSGRFREVPSLLGIGQGTDFWTGVRCPGKGLRSTAFWADTPYEVAPRLGAYRLRDLLAEPATRPDPTPGRTDATSARRGA